MLMVLAWERRKGARHGCCSIGGSAPFCRRTRMASDLPLPAQFEDLPILCRRHTTSKLRAYEDLDTIDTLGFRGEALASISYVAHMSVTTMTAGAAHGHKALYKVRRAGGPPHTSASLRPHGCARNRRTKGLVRRLLRGMSLRLAGR